MLSRVPCAIQEVLVSYLFYMWQYAYVSPNLPIYHLPCLTPSSPNIFYICNSYFCFVDIFSCTFFLDFTYKWCMIFDFFCLTAVSMTMSRSIHLAANATISFFFYGWVIFHCVCICICACVCMYVYKGIDISLFLCWWTFSLLPCPGYCK